MKRTITYLFLSALLCLCGQAQLSAKHKNVSLRLTSYNIQHGEGMDKRIDHARIARILRKAKAQVVAVQEVDSMTRRNGNVYALEEIGKKAHMHDTYAPAIDFQGGKYGIGMLSKKRPVSVRRIPLPGREEPRMLLVVEFKNYVVACTHLSLTEADRLTSAEIICKEAARWQKPFIVTGDLNDEPQSEFYRRMQEHFLFLNSPNEMTFPSKGPNICIDHIALYRNPAVTVSYHRTWVGPEQSSDHCPLHGRIGLYFEQSR